MTFASPLAFVLAATAIPIVIFYILKVRLRRVEVSTNLFWKQIYDEKPPRSIWQYLRHLLSLLAQLLLVTLLVLAVADPSFSWQLLQARRIVAVIDNSASMRCADVDSSRFEAAIEAALATANGLRFRDQMAIVLAGSEPEVVLGMNGHMPTIKRAFRSITVSDNATELDSAIALGRQLIGEHPHGQVLVFTDGCSAALSGREPLSDERRSLSEDRSPKKTPDPLQPASSVEYRVFGNPATGNVGITQFQVRRSLIDPLGYEVLAIVTNASSLAVKGRLELELDGVPVDVLPLDLQPDGVFTRSLEKTSLEGGTLMATLTGLVANDNSGGTETVDSSSASQINGLATDDQAWAILPSRQIQNVLIITPGNLFLQKVFEANPLVHVTVQKDFPETWPGGGIIVLHNHVPETLPPGSVFVVDPLDGCDAWTVGESLANPIITDQDKESPLMTHVRLDNVVMPAAKQLQFSQLPRVLAGSLSGDAVYAEVKRPNGKCLVLSVDINEGDLAFRTAFPIMVTNSLGWFAGQTGELRHSLATGTTTDIRLADESAQDELLLRSPSGSSQPLTQQGTDEDLHLSTPLLSECGVWSVVSAKTNERSEPLAEVAVNLANDEETDLRIPVDIHQDQPHASVAGWFTRPIWFYLATVACCVTVGEWWLYQRRVIT